MLDTCLTQSVNISTSAMSSDAVTDFNDTYNDDSDDGGGSYIAASKEKQ